MNMDVNDNIIRPDSHIDHVYIGREHYEDRYLFWQVQAYLSVICFPFILMLDGLLFVSIIIFRRYHNPHTIFIQGQVISDILFGIYTLSISAPNLVAIFPDFHNDTICVSLWTSFTLLEQIGLYMYIAITVDRFIAVHYPFWYIENMSVARAVKILGAILAFSTLVAVIVIPLWRYKDYECDYYSVYPEVYKIALMTEYIILPVVPFIMNIIIFRTSKEKLRSGSSQWSHLWGIEKRRSHSEREKSLYLSVVMSGAFVVCWTPVNVMSPVGNVHQHNRIIRDVLKGLYIWYSLYPLFNAAAILATKRSFFKAFRLLLTTPPWKWTLLRNSLDESTLSQGTSATFTASKTSNVKTSKTRLKYSSSQNVAVAWAKMIQNCYMNGGTGFSEDMMQGPGGAARPARGQRNTVHFMSDIRKSNSPSSPRSPTDSCMMDIESTIDENMAMAIKQETQV